MEVAQNILIQYFSWQVFKVPKNILKAWGNFLRFNLNYFSIPLLLKTLFSPWRRYKYSYGRGFNLKRYFNTFTFNIVSRLIGAAVRIIFILIGLAVEIFLVFAGAVIFIGWLVLPILLILGIYYGFKILF